MSRHFDMKQGASYSPQWTQFASANLLRHIIISINGRLTVWFVLSRRNNEINNGQYFKLLEHSSVATMDGVSELQCSGSLALQILYVLSLKEENGCKMKLVPNPVPIGGTILGLRDEFLGTKKEVSPWLSAPNLVSSSSQAPLYITLPIYSTKRGFPSVSCAFCSDLQGWWCGPRPHTGWRLRTCTSACLVCLFHPRTFRDPP